MDFDNAARLNQKHMENLRPAKQRLRLLRTNLPMGISQVAMFAPMNQKHRWGWKSAWQPLTPPGQDTNGLTHRELDHEPCLPAIP